MQTMENGLIIGINDRKEVITFALIVQFLSQTGKKFSGISTAGRIRFDDK
jgi:hypothetical protein